MLASDKRLDALSSSAPSTTPFKPVDTAGMWCM
jgi:hypothetical protein